MLIFFGFSVIFIGLGIQFTLSAYSEGPDASKAVAEKRDETTDTEDMKKDKKRLGLA